MKSRYLITPAVVVVSMLGASLPAASADSPFTRGKLVNYVQKRPHQGTLTARVKGKNLKLEVNKNTVCGYQKGESGGPMSCKTLKKYKGYRLNLSYRSSGGREVATFVGVVYPAPKQ